MNSVLIRKAIGLDAEPLLRLIRAHAAYEKAESLCTVAQLVAALDPPDPPLHGWIAWSDRTALGYATATLDFSTWRGARYLHMDRLFIHKDSRGQGVGKLLLNAVSEFGRKLDAKRIEWQTPSWNCRAIRFYEQLGAVGQEKVRFELSLS